METLKNGAVLFNERDAEPLWKVWLRDAHSPVEAIRLAEESATSHLDQGAEVAEVIVSGRPRWVRFHDYPTIFTTPGLYEKLFYERLGCQSPTIVAESLTRLLEQQGMPPSRIRLLDVGAGNGMVGEEMRARGVREIVGLDVLTEAKQATERDRPGLYDDYLVTDLTNMDEAQARALRSRRFNCMTMVAAMGVKEILKGVLVNAIDVLDTPAWVAFTVRVDLLDPEHPGRLSEVLSVLERDGVLQPYVYWRYLHRYLVNGDSVDYALIVAKKVAHARAAA